MALLLLLILFSAARPIVAPPSMLLPYSTTISASWNGASNKSASTSATLPSPDQAEIEDLGSYFTNLNKSLSAYCLKIQESAYSSWKTTNTQKTSVVTCTQNVTDSSCDNAGTYTETYPPQYTPIIKPPCCGNCVIQAWKAHALFWPTPAPQPEISTLVGADGFTYTSPSVYIIYEHLAATDFCGHPGSIMSNATVPLQQWQVSSVGPGDGDLTAVNFADLKNCSTNTPGSNTDAYEGAYDRCFPTLQYDISYLSTLQPAWATCVRVGGWVWDPPQAFTSVSSLNGVDPHNLDPKVASFSLTNPSSPSLTNLISPGAHLPSTPPMTKLPTDPPLPKKTPVDPLRQTSPKDNSHNAESDAAIQSPADLADPADPRTKLSNASSDPAIQSSGDPTDPADLHTKLHSAPWNPTIQSPADPADPANSTDPRKKLKNVATVGQGAHGPVNGPQNAATETTASTFQDPAVAKATDAPTSSGPDMFPTQNSSKDPTGDSSNAGASYAPQPIVVGDKTITVPGFGGAELKVGSQTLNVQNPVVTISNTPISLASDRLQIGTAAHIFISLTSTPAANVFAIGPESFTLNSQDVATDGTQIGVGGPKVTVDGTQVSLKQSELLVGDGGDGTQTSALATGNPLVEVDGGKGRTGAGVQAGTRGNIESLAGTDAGIQSSPMSSLGTVGGGAATASNRSRPGASGRAAVPFLGAASKVGDRVNLWISVGSWLWVVRCLIGV